MREPQFLLLPVEMRARIYDYVFIQSTVVLQTNFNRLPRQSNSAQLLRVCRQIFDEARPLLFAKLTFEVSFMMDLRGVMGPSALPLIQKVVWRVSLGQMKFLHQNPRRRWFQAGLRNIAHLHIIVHFPILWGLHMEDPSTTEEEFSIARRILRDIAEEIREGSATLTRIVEIEQDQLQLEAIIDDGKPALIPGTHIKVAAI